MKTNYFLKSAFVLAVFALGATQINAQEIVDGIAYKVVDGAAEVSALPKVGGENVYYSQSNIVIPATVTLSGSSYPVTKIGDGSMRNNNNLVSVSIPEGVKVIGNSSFAQCEALPSLVLPSSVNTIDVWAFYGCKALTSINIPSGVTIIPEHCFQNTGLTALTLPASVKTLDVCAFQDASSLATINLENVEFIKGYGIYGTAIGSIDLPNIKDLGAEAFAVCPNIETINLPNVVNTGAWCFKQCPKLVSVTMPNLNGLGQYAFEGSDNVETVKIGKVTSLGGWAFKNLSKLSTIDLGSSLEFINEGAFSGCASITSLTLPNTVAFIGNWTFEKTGLTEIFISWEDPETAVFAEENAFGVDEGKANFTWKVPTQQLKDIYGDEWLGYPVSVGLPSGIGHVLAENVKVYYNAGSLNLVGLNGYKASVVAMDGSSIATFQVNADDTQIPLSLTPGIYVLNATSNGTKAASKFIVK